MAWVEQSSNFFPRKLYSLPKSFFIYFFLRSTAISCSSTPPHLGLSHVGGGHSPLLPPCQAGRLRSSWDQSDTEGSGLGPPRPHRSAPSCSHPPPNATAVLSARGCSHRAHLGTINHCTSCGRQTGRMQPWPGPVVAEKPRRCLEKALGLLPLCPTLAVQAEITPPRFPG